LRNYSKTQLIGKMDRRNVVFAAIQNITSPRIIRETTFLISAIGFRISGIPLQGHFSVKQLYLNFLDRYPLVQAFPGCQAPQ